MSKVDPMETADRLPDTERDDFADLLHEYDFTVKPSAPDAPDNGPPADPSELLSRDLDTVEKGKLRDYALHLEAERQAEKAAKLDTEDLERVYAGARETIADIPHLPPSYAEMWMLKRWHGDPELQQVLADRYTSPAAKDRAERAVRRCLKDLREHAASLPNPDATADVALVTAAVRGSGYPKSKSSEPDWSKMDNREFSQETERRYGYRPSRLD